MQHPTSASCYLTGPLLVLDLKLMPSVPCSFVKIISWSAKSSTNRTKKLRCWRALLSYERETASTRSRSLPQNILLVASGSVHVTRIVTLAKLDRLNIGVSPLFLFLRTSCVSAVSNPYELEILNWSRAKTRKDCVRTTARSHFFAD